MSVLKKTMLDTTWHESIYSRRSNKGYATERTFQQTSSIYVNRRTQRLSSGLKQLKNKIDDIVRTVQDKKNDVEDCCENIIRTNYSINQYLGAVPCRQSSKSFGLQSDKNRLMKTSLKVDQSILTRPTRFKQNSYRNESEIFEEAISERLLNANLELSYCLQAQMARNKQLQNSQLFLTNELTRMKNNSNKQFLGEYSYQPSAIQSYCNSEKSMGNSLRY